LTKVEPAYKRTTVNIGELTSQKQEPSRFQPPVKEASNGTSDVVKGGYQPVGKIDISALRRQAQESGSSADDRPTTVKGAYEPIGKVDIAAIRAKAQPSTAAAAPSPSRPTPSDTAEDAPKSLAERSAAFTQSERISSMPKPKVANKFGSATSSFAGTKAPAPIGFSSKPLSSAAPIGIANKNFAEQGGKTPAQLWAEKKAKQGGGAPSGPTRTPSSSQPITSQPSGGEWKSGYSGKSWGAVQTTRTGQSVQSGAQEDQEEEREEEAERSVPSGGVSALKDRFKQAPPMGAPVPSRGQEDDEAEEDSSTSYPPPMNFSNKPNTGTARGVPMPGLPKRQPEPEEDDEIPDEEPTRMPTPPAQPPRSPTPDEEEERESSPIRVAMPIGRTQQKAVEPAFSPPTMPTNSLSKVVPHEEDLDDEPAVEGHDTARHAAETTAAASFGAAAVASANPGAKVSGQRATVQFDYEKAEDNELELKEGETVINIEMVDEDWWMGENERGESGLFPSNYVELIETNSHAAPAVHVSAPPPPAPAAAPSGGAAKKGPTATAQYEYEAVEDNELSFPDGAKITELVSLILAKRVLCKSRANKTCRSSQTTTGGWEATAAARDCSRPITYSWTSRCTSCRDDVQGEAVEKNVLSRCCVESEALMHSVSRAQLNGVVLACAANTPDS